MIKKFIFITLLFFVMIPVIVDASSNTLVKIGDNYYDDLEEAIEVASATDVIKLVSNIDLDNTLSINKVINIDLNGNDISAPSAVFLVQGGTLTINGEGTIRETEPNYGAIKVIGSNDPSVLKYSLVNIGENVSLEGWSGIFITHESYKSYGVVIYLAGKINAVSDINGGTGAGVYVNGNIKHQTNAPVINILDTAEIVSNGSGIYIAGYSTFNIDKSYISGVQSGIGIKAGILNINGATIVSTGEDSTPTEGYNNGINASGTAIQIESNNGYAGNIELNISSGDFRSKSSNVIYEYIGRGNSSLVKSINISGGTFRSGSSKDVFLFSDSFKQMHSNFVSGGEYSSDPSLYLKAGYNSVLYDNLYNVAKSTIKQVNSDNGSIIDSNSSLLTWLFSLITIVVLVILIYFNRSRIANWIQKYRK